MKKSYIVVITVAMALGLNGCSLSFFSQEARTAIFDVDKNTPKSQVVHIATADGISIWKIDGERKVNFVKLTFGGGLTSVTLPAGKHSLGCTIGQDIRIGSVDYIAGHDYLVDYTIDGRKVYYWVEDLTANTVVYGTKRNKG